MDDISQAPSSLINKTFILGFSYNFVMGFIFSNNALFPLYVEYSGGGAQSIGLFMGFLSLSGILCRPFIGYLVDRYGVKPLMMWGSLLFGLPCLGYLLLLDAGLVAAVWVLRLIQGFGWGAHMTAFLTLAAQASPPGRRNETVAKYGVSGLFATSIAPYIGEHLIKDYGIEYFFLFLSSMGILAFILISCIRVPVRSVHLTGFNIQGTYHILRLPQFRISFLLAICLAASFSTISSFLAPLATNREISSFSLFFTAFASTGVMIRFTCSQWGDRFGLVQVMIPGFFMYALGLIIIQISWNLGGILLAGLFCGIAHGITFPAVIALGYSLAPSKYRGSAMSLVTGMMDVGNMGNTILLGQIAGLWGYHIIFFVGATAPITAVLSLLFFSRHSREESGQIES